MINKLFVFDLDNTLVKTNRANNNSYKEAILAVTGKNVEIKKKRFTRSDLSGVLPNLSVSQIAEIAREKEKCYARHISETILNKQLVKILKLLKESSNETILLTESRKTRAQQVCEYYALTQCFTQQYYLEDYEGKGKYQYLTTLKKSLELVVLFENEQLEIQRAIKNGISENQIIKVVF